MDTIRPVISKPLTRTAPDRSEDTPPLQQLIADFLPTLWEVPHIFSPSTGPHAVTRGLDPAPGDAPRAPLHTTMNPRTGEGRAAAGGSVEEGQGCSAAAVCLRVGVVARRPLGATGQGWKRCSTRSWRLHCASSRHLRCSGRLPPLDLQHLAEAALSEQVGLVVEPRQIRRRDRLLRQ